MSADKTHVIRCSCLHGFLTFDAWDMGEPEHEWFAEFYESTSGSASLGWRVKKAFALLIGREVALQDVAMDAIEIKRLRDFLNETFPVVSSPDPVEKETA